MFQMWIELYLVVQNIFYRDKWKFDWVTRMEIDKKKFREEYPHLYEELESSEAKTPIQGIRSMDADDVDIIRLIRRCDNEEQVLEIISYMLKRGELSQEYADTLVKQLKEKGLRSFGSKVTWGYFEREYR